MIKLHFIVNPISGKGKHVIDETLLQKNFPSDQYAFEVDYTEYKNHAKELVALALMKNPDCVVACGGDGTINEVASSLVGTYVKLGIIPVGSGNGLASNLKIPKKINDAMDIIKNGIVSKIDVGTVNSHYFFSNMGIGIDSMIIKRYERAGKRTLLAYIKASIASSFSFKPMETTIETDRITIMEKPLMLFISNSNEMGYNMSLTPEASLVDGKLDMVVIPQLNLKEKIALGYNVLRNSIGRFQKAKQMLIEQCSITVPEKIFTDIQIDGEFHNLKTNQINVGIAKKALNVLTQREL